MIEAIGPDCKIADVRARSDPILDVFGPGRITAASNWPVTDLAGGAAKWFDKIWPMVDSLGEVGGATKIRVGTAKSFYRT